MSFFRLRALLFLALPVCTVAQLPDAPHRDTVQRICSGCHPAQIVIGRGMTREQWSAIVSNMISRGAKGSDEDFAQIVDYLTQNLPPGGGGPATAANSKAKKPKTLIDQAGANDKQVVDDEAAARGKTTYDAQCVACHGPMARGTKTAPDLVRSLVVLHDRYGSVIGAYLAKGHPTNKPVSLAHDQMVDLTHFLHAQVELTLRTGPFNKPLNILVGDPREGKAYFNGEGKCTQCHSTSGDLAHIGSKYVPSVLQLKMVFPQVAALGKRAAPSSRKPITATVTTPSGQQTTGVVDDIDDFNISIRDSDGQLHTFQRGPGVQVEKHNPYDAHIALLDRYTDKDMHDLVAYLETFK
jgi:mono/diheme cytochrome c family protein